MEGHPIVHIVDDDAAVRESMRWLVESDGLASLVYENAAEFSRSPLPDQPGCLVLDVRLPGMSGLDLQEHLAATGFALPILMVTAYGDVTTAVRAIRLGAIDVLEKPYEESTLLRRIREGIDKSVELRRKSRYRTVISQRLESLTPRERQVLKSVVQGQPSRRIAFDLGISVKTVEAHRARVRSKLQVTSLAELVRAVETIP